MADVSAGAETEAETLPRLASCLDADFRHILTRVANSGCRLLELRNVKSKLISESLLD